MLLVGLCARSRGVPVRPTRGAGATGAVIVRTLRAIVAVARRGRSSDERAGRSFEYSRRAGRSRTNGRDGRCCTGEPVRSVSERCGRSLLYGRAGRSSYERAGTIVERAGRSSYDGPGRSLERAGRSSCDERAGRWNGPGGRRRTAGRSSVLPTCGTLGGAVRSPVGVAARRTVVVRARCVRGPTGLLVSAAGRTVVVRTGRASLVRASRTVVVRASGRSLSTGSGCRGLCRGRHAGSPSIASWRRPVGADASLRRPIAAVARALAARLRRRSQCARHDRGTRSSSRRSAVRSSGRASAGGLLVLGHGDVLLGCLELRTALHIRADIRPVGPPALPRTPHCGTELPGLSSAGGHST